MDTPGRDLMEVKVEKFGYEKGTRTLNFFIGSQTLVREEII